MDAFQAQDMDTMLDVGLKLSVFYIKHHLPTEHTPLSGFETFVPWQYVSMCTVFPWFNRGCISCTHTCGDNGAVQRWLIWDASGTPPSPPTLLLCSLRSGPLVRVPSLFDPSQLPLAVW